MVVGERHIEMSKNLGLVVVQVGSVPQLMRDTGKKRRSSSLTTRRRALVGGQHCVV